MARVFVVVAMATALSGCVTAQEQMQQEQARWDGYLGRTVADFISATMLTPVDKYDLSGSRVFVFAGAPRTTVLPGSYGVPTVGADATCRVQVEAVNDRASNTADGWCIVQIRRAGGCDGLV
ncbi:hypothetical protein GCM10007036_16720 [Alsobacter metallidurans]|uniref:Lipoprotein n=1 Tax=Alsobacter metallidurans TaxID=340221 RepID=A0A917MJ97_9HYPH|nr:hypothetical protein GCM10007036_16720 [Alsobacter metallidurans]